MTIVDLVEQAVEVLDWPPCVRVDVDTGPGTIRLRVRSADPSVGVGETAQACGAVIRPLGLRIRHFGAIRALAPEWAHGLVVTWVLK